VVVRLSKERRPLPSGGLVPTRYQGVGLKAARLPPELVIGLVGSIGADLDKVTRFIEGALGAVGYSYETIRLSHLLPSLPATPFSTLPEQGSVPDDEWYRAYMDAGNELRRVLARRDAMALLGMAQIRALRQAAGRASDDPRPEHAYVLRSLKTPEEVEILRSVYRSRFVLIGAFDSEVRREGALIRRIMDSRAGWDQAQHKGRASELMSADEEEGVPNGQNVRDTFHRSDFFVDCTMHDDEQRHSVERFIRLFFGSNEYTPSMVELAMYHAYAASLRSGDLGRQVGSAIIDDYGALIATGTNEVAAAGGGQLLGRRRRRWP
jgi:hypothetical protein